MRSRLPMRHASYWINAWYIPKSEVTRQAFGILADTTVNYPIGMQLDNEGVVRATSVTQVLRSLPK